MATDTKTPTPTPSREQRAAERASYLTGFLWHAGAFVIINALFWILDAGGDGSVTWSYMVTLFWGFGLAFHGLAYLIDGRQIEERKTREYLAEDDSSQD